MMDKLKQLNGLEPGDIKESEEETQFELMMKQIAKDDADVKSSVGSKSSKNKGTKAEMMSLVNFKKNVDMMELLKDIKTAQEKQGDEIKSLKRQKLEEDH